MSDTPEGADWWPADDGKWYPPERWTGPPGSSPPANTIYQPSPAAPTVAPPQQPLATADGGRITVRPKLAWYRRLPAMLIAAAILFGAGFVARGLTGSDPVDETIGSAGPSTTSPECPDGMLMGDSGCKAMKNAKTTTTKAATTTTTAAPRPETRSFSGTGADVVDVGETVTDPYLVKLTHKGSSNFQVSLLTESGDRAQSLTNAVGGYEGSVPANFSQGESFKYVEVAADGEWTVEFVDLLNAPTASTEVGQTYSGTGDQVVFFNTTSPVPAQLTCANCQGNFQVTAWGDDRQNLVNEIGAYSGRVLVPADTTVIQIFTSLREDSPVPTWSITPG